MNITDARAVPFLSPSAQSQRVHEKVQLGHRTRIRKGAEFSKLQSKPKTIMGIFGDAKASAFDELVGAFK